ncbi:MAG TPA: alpha/beta fold hydrolase [Chitinophagaceae bacterium]|nr:alpha/beta fold hydrolase [Chitinophagaceae bacterium]
MRILRIFSTVLLVLILLYWIGPKPVHPQYRMYLPDVPDNPRELDSFVRAEESRHHVKPDNEARIVWFNDSLKTPTDYAVVYLHGFSASQEEGNPVHRDFARRFGCNLYLSRLADHGIDTTEPMVNLTADRLWNSAKEAYAIGTKLGRKVILLSTSTGGTLALKLASEYPDIAGIILMSPNIEINDPNAWLLNNPWGLQVAHLVKGKYNTSQDTSAIYRRYWYSRYRMEAAVQLEELLETTMKSSLFEKVTQPVLLLYYYQDEKHQDPVVRVSAMKRMFRELGTADSLKREVDVPQAGDHVLGCYIKSHDVPAVEQACTKFAEQVLHLRPVTP